MIKPKNYEINVDITEKLLVRNKFKEKDSMGEKKDAVNWIRDEVRIFFN